MRKPMVSFPKGFDRLSLIMLLLWSRVSKLDKSYRVFLSLSSRLLPRLSSIRLGLMSSLVSRLPARLSFCSWEPWTVSRLAAAPAGSCWRGRGRQAGRQGGEQGGRRAGWPCEAMRGQALKVLILAMRGLAMRGHERPEAMKGT